MVLSYKETLVVASTLYIMTVYHLNQGYIKNKQFIDPFYKKPSFGRYNKDLCEDAISIEQEMTQIADKIKSKYQKQGLALTRDMYLPASSNLKSTSSDNNVQSRLKNRIN